ncbi:hypothetical protein [Paenibacillus sp. Leaf72]|uniref:hypothetical protein n=1 Tax=Paenibacillus sp. Leaf72 TaxID=1736234 RepID=UPI0006FCBC2F|nr:hypothetical protein [Paenibacillus sp. Leaf72]KQO18202.1 hypothetical protein ASF12_06085 [Paenibacillus sp. Leaf72]
MRKRISLALSLILFFTLFLNSFSFAATPIDSSVKENIQYQKDLYTAIKEIEENNLNRNPDGTFEIIGEPSVEQEILDHLVVSVHNINDLIESGNLVTDESFRVYSTGDIQKGNLETNKTVYVEYDIFFEDVINRDQGISVEMGETNYSLSFNGNTVHADSYNPPVGLYFYWWGWELSLSEYATQVLINGLNTGAASAAVASALQAAGIITAGTAAVTGIIAAVVWFGGAAIGLADSLGGNKGIYFRGLYAPPVYYVWARS